MNSGDVRGVLSGESVLLFVGSACFWSWYDMAFFYGAYCDVGSKTENYIELSFCAVIISSIVAFIFLAHNANKFDGILKTRRANTLIIVGTLLASLITISGVYMGNISLVLIGSTINGMVLGVGYELWGMVYSMEGAKSASIYVPLSIAIGVLFDVVLFSVQPFTRAIFTSFLPVISISTFIFILKSKTITLFKPDEAFDHATAVQIFKSSPDNEKKRYLYGMRYSLLVAALIFTFSFAYMEHFESYFTQEGTSSSVFFLLVVRGVTALLCYVVTRILNVSLYSFYRRGLLVMIAGFLLMPFLSLIDSLNLMPGTIIMAGYTCYDILICIMVSEISFYSKQSSLHTFGISRLFAQTGLLFGLLFGTLVSTLYPSASAQYAIVTTAIGYFLIIATIMLLDEGSGYWAMLRYGTATQLEAEIKVEGNIKRQIRNRYSNLKELGCRYGLTTRELEIANELMDGRSAPSIARRFYISENTVRSHIRSIYAKLDVHNKQEMLDLLESCISSFTEKL